MKKSLVILFSLGKSSKKIDEAKLAMNTLATKVAPKYDLGVFGENQLVKEVKKLPDQEILDAYKSNRMEELLERTAKKIEQQRREDFGEKPNTIQTKPNDIIPNREPPKTHDIVPETHSSSTAQELEKFKQKTNFPTPKTNSENLTVIDSMKREKEIVITQKMKVLEETEKELTNKQTLVNDMKSVEKTAEEKFAALKEKEKLLEEKEKQLEEIKTAKKYLEELDEKEAEIEKQIQEKLLAKKRAEEQLKSIEEKEKLIKELDEKEKETNKKLETTNQLINKMLYD